MAATKCPNPDCSFLFDASKVPAGALIACPQCTMRFKLAEVPSASALDFAASAGPADANRTPSVARTRPPTLIIATVVLVIAGTAVLVYSLANRRGTPKPSNDVLYKDHNVAIGVPESPWVRDRDLETTLGFNLGLYRRSSPEGWYGLFAQTYGTTNARISELTDVLTDRLKRLCENLSLEVRTNEPWLGRDAIRQEFRGTDKAQRTIRGECFTVSIQGIAYFFIGWALEGDVAAVAPEFPLARERVRLLGLRESWTEAAPANAAITGKKESYQLTDREGLWKTPRNANAADHDPNADLVLAAEYLLKGRKSDVKQRAEVLTFVLPGTANPLQAAREYVTSRESRNPELFKEFQFNELVDPPQGDDADEDGAAGSAVVRLRMSHPSSPDVEKLIVIGAVAVNGKVIAVEASCPWNERSTWERRLMRLAGSLRSAP